jgi:hypothetical protein
LADQISSRDFRFVSGSNALACDRFQAGFISPRIANLVLSDPTIDEFSIAGVDSIGWEVFHKLVCGQSVFVDEGTADLFIVLSENLGNIELSEKLLNCFDGSKELNVSNSISRLNRKKQIGIVIARELEFISCHISEFSVDALLGNEAEVLRDIFESESLRIPNEHWLLELIFALGPKYSMLLCQVRFEYLRPSSIDLFFERVYFDQLNFDI